MTGHDVHRERVRLGLTQEQFAQRIGCSVATLNRWENGAAGLSAIAVRRLERLLAGETVPPPTAIPLDVPARLSALEVARARHCLGLTQEAFARELGVTFSAVSRWENGHNTPSRLGTMAIQALLKREERGSVKGGPP